MKTQTLFQLLLLFLFLGFFTKVFAQSHISGTAQETNGEALPFANVLLLNPSDSSLVNWNKIPTAIKIFAYVVVFFFDFFENY